MANTPKKVKDPTEVALSAIQEALNISDVAPTEPTRDTGSRRDGGPAPSPKSFNDPSFDDQPIAMDNRAQFDGAENRAPRRAANDDRETIGQLLQAIQKGRPGRNAYTLATVFSGVWLAGAVLLTISFLPSLQTLLGQGSGGVVALAGLIALFAAPVLLCYFLATLAWRGQEMRMIAQSMAQVAIRFSEPEGAASDSMVTVGQAIRREVAAMGDGVERAIARAGELETLVANEVAALERAYSDNEVRIRALLQDIAHQRDNLVGQAEQVRAAISGVQIDLRQDIAVISDAIASRVDEVARTITMALEERGQHITQALGNAGDTMILALGERGGDLLDRLEEASSETTRAVLDASERLTASLNFKTGAVHEEFVDLADRVHDMLNERIDRVTREFAEQSANIVDSISDRTELVHDSLKTSSESLLLELELRSNDLVHKIDESGLRLSSRILDSGDKANDALDGTINTLVAKVVSQTETAHDNLSSQMIAFDELMREQGSELAEKFSRDSGTLGALITRHIAEFDRTVKTFGGEIVDRMGQRTQDITDTLKTYVDTFDNRVTARAGDIHGALDQRLAAFHTTLESRVTNLDVSLDTRIKAFDDNIDTRIRSFDETVDGRLKSLETSFDNRARSVTDTIDTRLHDLTNTLSGGAAQAIDALNDKAATLSTVLTDGTAHAVDLLDSRIAHFTSSLTNGTTEVAGALDTRIVELTSSLQSGTAAVVGALDTRIATLTSSLAQGTSHAIDAIDQRINTVTEIIDGRSAHLTDTVTSRFQAIHDGLENRAGAVASDIETRVTQFENLLGSRIENVANRFESTGRQASDVLVARAEELTQSIRARVDDAERSLVVLMNNTADSIQNNARLAHESLSNVSGDIGAQIKAAVTEAEQTLTATGATTVAALFNSSREAQTALITGSEEATTRARTLSGDIERALASATATTTESVLASVREAQNTLISMSTDTATQTRNLSAEVERMLSTAGSSTVESVLASAREVHTTLLSASSETANHVKTLSSDIEQTLAAAGNATAAAIMNSAREVQSTLLTVSSEATGQIKALANEIEHSVSFAGTSTADSVMASARGAQSLLLATSSDAAAQIQAISDNIERTINSVATTAADVLQTSSRDAHGSVIAASNEASAAVMAAASNASATLSSMSRDTSAELTTAAQAASNILSNMSQENATVLTTTARETATGLTDTARETAATLISTARETIAGLTTAARDTSAELTTAARETSASVTNTSRETSKALTAVSQEAIAALATASRDASASVVAASNEASSKVKSTSSEIERSVITVTGQFGTVLLGKTDEIVTGVKQQADRLAQMVDASRGSLIQALGDRTNQINIDITRVTDDALKSIESKGTVFSQNLIKNSADLARTITNASEIATGAVNKSLKDIELTTRNAIDQSRQVAAAAVTEMQETSKILRTDTVALFERLREGNILLQEVLTGAHDNLNSLEQALVTRVADFVSTMNDVTSRNGVATNTLEDQLTVFNTKTNKALEDLGSLSGQFAAHGQLLADAAAMVEKSNKSTTQTVSERKADLESLVTTIDLRTADLDQRLSRFTGLLDESLAAAETRARDIARVVADTAGSGATAITQQFKAVREAAEDERRHTAEAMSELYEQNTSHVEALFKQSTDKFAGVVQSMKQMAGEMHRELEATREELRRGVLEIPQEAADSTSQMRKVIVDQIEALAELNKIVARHGRGLDVVSSNTSSSRSYQRDEEPMMATAAAGSRGNDVPSRPAPRRDSSASNLPPPDIGLPMAQPRRTEAPPVSPSADQSGDGWLSGLLNRADTGAEAPRSRPAPQPARPAASNGNPLDSLTVDIARLVDRDLAAEMWDRYQRGERKAFTKRLYTPAGQKAFDEVSRKYRAERSFKQTVDRYITEFERLLDDVARDERGAQTLRGYLTSETGLVYTLLAHAAGRLG
ncbi:negative regulator of septation ring formation [Bradyrhizobium prioriisuperbiae]|uniref:apolipoprotein A-IV repeat region-like domain-containing protein n=1 Tax=Bradyrhizobium prioriisuperbiae TaxID=2854389 RepID=UPI0028E3CE3F|nr:negative regulator of septation ring formation [Bradyrhizobium prioritasuperba]